MTVGISPIGSGSGSGVASDAAFRILGDPDDITAYAMDRTQASDNYLLSLSYASQGLIPPTITPEFPTVGVAPSLSVDPPPAMQTIVWTAPAAPAPFLGELAIEDVFPEPFDTAAPVMAFPPQPAAFSEASPPEPAVDLIFDLPELVITLPAPPVLLTISTHNFSGVTLPTIDFTLPELVVVPPSLIPYVPGDAYTSALLTAIQTYLQNQITNGGGGINTEVEEALFGRAREREARTRSDAILELEKMEILGYAFPPGVYMDARTKIVTETAYTEAGLSREILIKAWEMEFQATSEALKTATTLEATLIQMTNAVEQRLFEAAKYATEGGIAIYNAQVQAYVAYLDAYKTKVQIYEAQIKGELAKVEVYKAELQAEETKAQINNSLVAQYKVQAEISLSAIEVYKAEIAGIQAKADIEKTKVMIFGEQVKAYSARINAYTAQVEGFRAAIQAEASKQEAFKSQVQAYAAQVDAAAKSAQILIEEYKGHIEAKTAEWEGYKAASQAEASRAQAIASNNSSLAEGYKAQVSGKSAYNEVLTKQWQVALDQAQRVSEIGVAAAKANGDLYMTSRSIAMESAKVGAQVSAQLGAAALNAINWSSSYSTASSFADSASTSTNYNYNASV